MEAMFENDLRHSTEYTLGAIQESVAVGTNHGVVDGSVSFAVITAPAGVSRDVAALPVRSIQRQHQRSRYKLF
jgi:hypothetical protein